MSLNVQPLSSGTAVQSAAADNAVATATVPVQAGVSNYLVGFWADYDVTVSAIKSVTVTRTYGGASKVEVYLHDFTNGPFGLPLPGVIHGDEGTAITVALAASGAGSTNGRVIAYYFTN